MWVLSFSWQSDHYQDTSGKEKCFLPRYMYSILSRCDMVAIKLSRSGHYTRQTELKINWFTQFSNRNHSTSESFVVWWLFGFLQNSPQCKKIPLISHHWNYCLRFSSAAMHLGNQPKSPSSLSRSLHVVWNKSNNVGEERCFFYGWKVFPWFFKMNWNAFFRNPPKT